MKESIKYYSPLKKLFEFSTSNNLSGQSTHSIDYLKLYVIIFKIYVQKETESSIGYEEICKEIFGNEYYYLTNIYKLMNSVTNSS